MTNLTLTFTVDQETRSPRLMVVSGKLTEAERLEAEGELKQYYQALTQPGHNGQFSFKRCYRGIPTHAVFQVGQLTGPTARSPGLRLEYAPGTADATPAHPSWVTGFLAEMQQLALEGSNAHVVSAEGTGLTFACNELCALAQEHPGLLGPVLLSNYLEMAERTARSQDELRAGLYLLALRGLEKRFDGTLVGSTDEAEPEGVQSPEEPLPWASRLLGWLLRLG
jgi:hypothetical protein